MNPFEQIRDAIADRVRALQVVVDPPGPRAGTIPVLSYEDHKIESKLVESIQAAGISVVVRAQDFDWEDRQITARFEVVVFEKPVDNNSDLGAQIDSLSLAFNICATLEQFQPVETWTPLHNIKGSPLTVVNGLHKRTITMQTQTHFNGRQ